MEKTSFKLAFVVVLLVMASGMPFSTWNGVEGTTCVQPIDCRDDCKPGCKRILCWNHQCICGCDPLKD
ncbi:hypothetical protein AAC387_Pa11g0456 [Persea americana]